MFVLPSHVAVFIFSVKCQSINSETKFSISHYHVLIACSMARPHVASLVNQDTHTIKRRRTLKHKAHLIYITLTPPRGVAFYVDCCHPSNTPAWRSRSYSSRKHPNIIEHARLCVAHNHLNNNKAAIKGSWIGKGGG